jgi:hypothetical protein
LGQAQKPPGLPQHHLLAPDRARLELYLHRLCPFLCLFQVPDLLVLFRLLLAFHLPPFIRFIMPPQCWFNDFNGFAIPYVFVVTLTGIMHAITAILLNRIDLPWNRLSDGVWAFKC